MVVRRRALPPVALVRYLDDLDAGASGGATAFMRPGEDADALAERLPEDARAGLTSDLRSAVSGAEAGVVALWDPPTLRLVLPPFPVPEMPATATDGLDTGPLRTLLASEPLIAVVLVRLGRYGIGVYRGRALVASKTDRRYVKGQHRAGGTSANRFRRIREKQADELFKAVCRSAQALLSAYEGQIEHLLLGGERSTLQGFRNRCPYLARFDGVLRRRVLDVREPGQAALEGLQRTLWESVVYEVTVGEG